MSENPIDRHYHQLHCSLNPLDHTSDEFKVKLSLEVIRRIFCVLEYNKYLKIDNKYNNNTINTHPYQ